MAEFTVEFRDSNNAAVWTEGNDYSTFDRARVANIVVLDDTGSVANTYTPAAGEIATAAFFRRRTLMSTNGQPTVVKFFGFPADQNSTIYTLESGVVTARTFDNSAKYSPVNVRAGEFTSAIFYDFANQISGFSNGTFYSQSVANQVFSPLTLHDGNFNSGSASIETYNGRKCIKYNYTSGDTGGYSGSWQEWKFPGYNNARLKFQVCFPPSYESVLTKSDLTGGKMPGLACIGTTSAYSDGKLKAPQHCVSNIRDTDGWSARHNWQRCGGYNQYLYWKHKGTNCGDKNHFNDDIYMNCDPADGYGLNTGDFESWGSRDCGTIVIDQWDEFVQEIDVSNQTIVTYLNGTLRAHTYNIDLVNQSINCLIWSPYINRPGPGKNCNAYYRPISLELW